MGRAAECDGVEAGLWGERLLLLPNVSRVRSPYHPDFLERLSRFQRVRFVLGSVAMGLRFLGLPSLAVWLVVGVAVEGQPVVEVEEVVYRYEPADNGAGPMWCAGSTSLFRDGGRVFATGLETMAGEKPLNNCRWVLFERQESGWRRRFVDSGRTREPAPMVGFHDGRFFVSGNGTLGKGPEPGGGPTRPDIIRFDARQGAGDGTQLLPVWRGEPPFREHSYRSFAADGSRGEFILLQNIGYGHAEWAFRNQKGQWSAAGKLEWPRGEEYDPPRPVRLCYPNVALKDRAVHFFGIGDITEPVEAWREFKAELTGRKWDYVFRRLYYCHTGDVEQQPFSQWIEIATRESTAGALWPCDLWVDADNTVHLLWTEQAVDGRLRERFFPDARQSHALRYAIVQDGRIVIERDLYRSEEGKPGLVAGRSRFHVTPDQRLFVVSYVSGRGTDGQSVSENRLFELKLGGAMGPQYCLGLDRPFTNFFTATPRGGSKPTQYLDLLGTQSGLSQRISYARVRIE